MMRGWVALAALAWMAGTARADDLARARAEPNLEKRARLALDESVAALEAARSDYQKGDTDRVAADAAKIVDSVDLAFLSLNQTGKDPRKSSRWFKYAEIQTRGLLRKLDTLERDMNFADRPLLEKATTEVQQVHDKLLLGLMEGKPK
ncbi:MAG: hypothetical protein ABSH00_08770 [Bryobacteraceae bacterium]|jgi:uncharacterized protein YPO0396